MSHMSHILSQGCDIYQYFALTMYGTGVAGGDIELGEVGAEAADSVDEGGDWDRQDRRMRSGRGQDIATDENG